MLSAEQVLADVRRWGVELEVTSRAECPLCLRVRFPPEMPDGLRRLVSRAVAQRRFEVASLVAGGEAQDTRTPDARAERGREGPRARAEDREPGD